VRALLLFAIRRLASGVPLVLLVVTVNFALIHLAPGDPIAYLGGDAAQLSEEQLAELRATLGLDQPLPVQWFKYVSALARGDLGTSLMHRQPVLWLILDRLPATALLMSVSLAVALVVGLALGFVSAVRAGTLTDYSVTFFSILTYSMPPFWLGLVLIILFSLTFDWFPTIGMVRSGAELSGWAWALDIMNHLVLPTLALGTSYAAIYARVFRTSLAQVLSQPFLTTAQAKGLTWSSVYIKHATRNAAIPVVTIVGLQLGLMLTGSILTEIVFAWPGLGPLVLDSLLQRDYPVILGVTVFVSTCVLLANAMTDMFYAVIDPRVRL
jgi:peptide/nickel transport system permease protein